VKQGLPEQCAPGKTREGDQGVLCGPVSGGIDGAGCKGRTGIVG